ncbi:MAG: transporter [Candidatus Aquirickettsiella sp.]
MILNRIKPTKLKRSRIYFSCIILFYYFVSSVQAGEIGHYIPGSWDARSFVPPPPGIYFTLYNYLYTSDDLKDRNGNSILSATIKGVPTELNIDVNTFFTAPTFLWSSNKKLFGANYALMAIQPIANPSLQAFLQIQNTGPAANQSSWGLGDLYLRPIWLTWHWPYLDISGSYALYAPSGRYTSFARNNIGLGFWTNEWQLASGFYFDKQHSLAFLLTATYDINQRKTDMDIKPGNYFTLNWGISKYLSFDHGILEIAIPGYDQWQVSHDSGSALLTNVAGTNQVHAAGGQLGYTFSPWDFTIIGKFMQEFNAKARFQGRVYTLSLTYKF